MSALHRRSSLLSLLLILLITLSSAAPTRTVRAADPEYVWVLVSTEVNPANGKTAFFGGGQDPEWFAEPRFEGKSLVYGVSENLFQVHERQVDHGYEYADITMTAAFDSPPARLEPGEEVTLQAAASRAGEVHEGGSPGLLQFQYRSDDLRIQPDAPFYYAPWSEGFDGIHSTRFTFTAPSAFNEGEEFQISAVLWNTPSCHVVWTFQSQPAGSQESTGENQEQDDAAWTWSNPVYGADRCEELKDRADEHFSHLKRHGMVGITIAAMGDVRVRHCEGDVEPIQKGSVVTVGDCIQTGPDGRVRVQMGDRDEARNAGPSVINFATNSEMCFSEFLFMRDKNRSTFDLIKGAIRTFFRGWRGDAQVSVRTGVTICGARGTDFMITYQPERSFSGLLVQEGIVDVTHRETGDTTTLTAGEMIAADQTSLFGQGTFTEEEWEDLLEEKGIAESSPDPAYYPEALQEAENEEAAAPSEAGDGSSDEGTFADQDGPGARDGFLPDLEGIFNSRWALLGGGFLVCGGGLAAAAVAVGIWVYQRRKKKGEEPAEADH